MSLLIGTRSPQIGTQELSELITRQEQNELIADFRSNIPEIQVTLQELGYSQSTSEIEGSIEEKAQRILSTTRSLYRHEQLNKDPQNFGYDVERHVIHTSLILLVLIDKYLEDCPEEEAQSMLENLPLIIAGVYSHDIGKLMPKKVRETLASKDRFRDLPIPEAKVRFHNSRLHTLTGWFIAGFLGFGDFVSDIALNHHQRPDGNGYPMMPDGNRIVYSERNIPILYLMVSAADTLSSILDPEKAMQKEGVTTINRLLSHMSEIRGHQLDSTTHNLVQAILYDALGVNVMNNGKTPVPSYEELLNTLRSSGYRSRVMEMCPWFRDFLLELPYKN